ncbi:hydrogenase maturation factor [Gottschalkia purinilytica]|uniref:Hydrogenase maturation factor n=1 Tax=Gottschalkia purinilytica TaxID=1503 RepID=A0A0L0W6S8_GOTPU|nr:AIR synthase family protein [Gottschalkia purinilytica]KNF07234.1 hydrogenase maturation factor [Gottschalkia purinilytica]
MEIGKVPNDLLEKLVFENIKNKREEVIVHAGVGKDCSVIDFGEYSCVVSTDPITGATHNIGSLAINISCNDVAASGAEPIGVLMTILAPANTTEKDLEQIMKDAGKASEKLNVEIVGGHTEITDAVNRVVITTTVIGKQLKERVITMENIKVGDKILITKSAGIEGTSIIANELEDRLKNKLSEELIREAQALGDNISVVKEGMICASIGVNYMHDITEGGVLGAIWEASEAIGKGVKVKRELIPIKQSTNEICSIFNINPLRLISSGSMLIIASDKNSELILKELRKENIQVTIIGEVTEEDIIIEEDGQGVTIDPPQSDELYKVI